MLQTFERAMKAHRAARTPSDSRQCAARFGSDWYSMQQPPTRGLPPTPGFASRWRVGVRERCRSSGISQLKQKRWRGQETASVTVSATSTHSHTRAQFTVSSRQSREVEWKGAQRSAAGSEDSDCDCNPSTCESGQVSNSLYLHSVFVAITFHFLQ